MIPRPMDVTRATSVVTHMAPHATLPGGIEVTAIGDRRFRFVATDENGIAIVTLDEALRYAEERVNEALARLWSHGLGLQVELANDAFLRHRQSGGESDGGARSCGATANADLPPSPPLPSPAHRPDPVDEIHLA